MAPKLTINASGQNNGNGQTRRKKAKKAKKDLKQFTTDYAADPQAAFDGMGNGPKFDKLRDLAIALIDQNTNLLQRVEALEARLNSIASGE